MQGEIDAQSTGVLVQILGVNQDGFQSGHATFVDGRDIALLEETAAQDVWAEWNVTYRDVVILDGNNEVVDVYNLTENSLGEAGNYATLQDLLITAANR